MIQLLNLFVFRKQYHHICSRVFLAVNMVKSINNLLLLMEEDMVALSRPSLPNSRLICSFPRRLLKFPRYFCFIYLFTIGVICFVLDRFYSCQQNCFKCLLVRTFVFLWTRVCLIFYPIIVPFLFLCCIEFQSLFCKWFAYYEYTETPKFAFLRFFVVIKCCF